MIFLLRSVRSNWFAITLFIFTMITTLSLWPLEQLPSVPGGDKAHHLIAYAALIFSVVLRKPKHWILIALLFILYGGIIELLQPYVNRYGEWLDLAANTAGVLCGIVLAELMIFIFPSAVSKDNPDYPQNTAKSKW